MTPELLVEANALNGSIEHLTALIATFPDPAPAPVNLSDIIALCTAIAELRPEDQDDVRIIEMVQTANSDYYTALKAAAEALKTTMDGEFTALGEEGE